MTRVYYHCGQLGDVIYSLPTIQAIGPGKLVTSLRKDRHDSLATFLRHQSCITEIEHFPGGRPLDWQNVPPGMTHDLNLMRQPQYAPLHVRPLIESHALPFGVEVDSISWLEPARGWGFARYDRALVSRSFRYRRDDISWRVEIDYLFERHPDVVFVGLESEYVDFCRVGAAIPWLPCATAEDLARAVYESRAFSGNQSFPLSLAIGFGLPHRIERAPGHGNCSYPDTVEIP